MTKNSGVGLIEVMIAIVLISLTLGTIIGLQGRMLRRSLTNARTIEYFIAVKNFFADIGRYQNRDDYPREKLVADLDLKMTYVREKPKSASTLSKINHIMIGRIETTGRTRKTYIKLIAQLSREKPS